MTSFIDLYEYLHRNHDEKASLYPRSTEEGRAERARRADEAVKLAIAFERAAIALVGQHRRRAYAHDLVYGLHKLYELYGKPWNGATEGAEHAHQVVKTYFLKMSCHSEKHAQTYHGVYHQVMRNTELVKKQLCRERAHLDFNASEYNARKANCTFTVATREKIAARRAGGPKSRLVRKIVGGKEKKYQANESGAAEAKMLALREKIAEYK